MTEPDGTELQLADMPEWIGRRSATLALYGYLLHWLLEQPEHSWLPLLERIRADGWRARLEVIEDDDGPDMQFALEVDSGTGWELIVRTHRETIGLGRLDREQIDILLALGTGPPGDVSELGE